MSKKEQKVNTGAESTVKSEPSQLEIENSPGMQLARAREALGLSQQQAADRLHLRISSLIAVERDELEPGVSVTFNKGYVRLYARLVNLDAQTLLDAYERLHVKDKDPAKLQSFSRKITRDAHDHRGNMVTIVVILLVLGSVIAWWVQRSDTLDDSQNIVSNTIDNLFNETQSSNTDLNSAESNLKSFQNERSDDMNLEDITKQDTGPLIPEDALTENSNELDFETSNDDSYTVDEELVDAESMDAADLLSNNTVEDSTESLLTDGEAIADGPDNSDTIQMLDETVDDTAKSLLIAEGYDVNADGTVNVVFTFKEDCWVSVKEVTGEVMAIGTKTKGRVMEVSGLPPIRIILGTVKAVDINFAGKDVNMSRFPSNQSAKFKLPLESE